MGSDLGVSVLYRVVELVEFDVNVIIPFGFICKIHNTVWTLATMYVTRYHKN